MDFLAKIAATLLTALVALAANLTPGPAIPVVAAAEVDPPAVTSQLQEPGPILDESDCREIKKILRATIQVDLVEAKLHIVPSESAVEYVLLDFAGLQDGTWSPKSNAIATLPWYVDQRRQQDCVAFPIQITGSPQLTR